VKQQKLNTPVTNNAQPGETNTNAFDPATIEHNALLKYETDSKTLFPKLKTLADNLTKLNNGPKLTVNVEPIEGRNLYLILYSPFGNLDQTDATLEVKQPIIKAKSGDAAYQKASDNTFDLNITITLLPLETTLDNEFLALYESNFEIEYTKLFWKIWFFMDKYPRKDYENKLAYFEAICAHLKENGLTTITYDNLCRTLLEKKANNGDYNLLASPIPKLSDILKTFRDLIKKHCNESANKLEEMRARFGLGTKKK